MTPPHQAARVSYQCFYLKETGFHLRTRPLVYREAQREDLDSYLIFIQAANLRVSGSSVT